uniref:D-alanine--D-alanine ligase n=1 Tax=Anthurium amnicola TaxID=1678845 RepID=A0A1D1YY41_9ARAE
MGSWSGVMALLLLGVYGASCATTAAAAATREGRVTVGLDKARLHPLSDMRPGFLYSRLRGRCTPEFWSTRREAWPKMVPQEASVWKVFGSRALERYEPELTVLEATQRNDDIGGSAFSQLVKQSSAALLNSYTREGFPYTAWEVKTLLIQALISEESARSQARHFAEANQVCT